MIAGPVVPRNLEDVLEGVRITEDKADIIEIRFDTLKKIPTDEDLKEIRNLTSSPIIGTARAVEEGGKWSFSEKERMDLIARCSRAGFDYVDCELFALNHLPEISQNTSLIVSFHDFKKVPENVQRIAREIEQTRADVVKLSCMAVDITDNFTMLEILKAAEKPTVALCMGERGVISRILGRAFGQYFTFGCVSENRMSAPGQVLIDDLRNLYRYKEINKETQVFGVAANPVCHSASPTVHNAALKKAGINGVYLPFLVDDMESFLRKAFLFNVKGISVTIPYKVPALNLSVQADELARKIGSANTLVRHADGYHAANTDCFAAIEPVKKLISLENKKVLLLGAGGAARAVAFGLREENADVFIYNRTLEKAKKLADVTGSNFVEILDPSVDYNVIVNTTSVGMWPDTDKSPVSKDFFRNDQVVFDAVYNPRETLFLRQAEKAGAKVIDGIEMFVTQAAEQFRLFTGDDAPVGVMERALLDFLEKKTALTT